MSHPLRTNIEKMVYDLLSYSWLTPQDESDLRNFLYVDDAQVDEAHAILNELYATLLEIESKAHLEQKAVFDGYTAKLQGIQHGIDRAARQYAEAGSETTESIHEAQLLQQLDSANPS